MTGNQMPSENSNLFSSSTDLPPERILEVQSLRKYFPIRKGFIKKTVGHVKSVDGINFHINEGETLGLVGESGCGKTTTARCILRAMKPTEGKIQFKTTDGSHTDLATLKEDQIRSLRTDIQMIFQDPFASLNPRMNILDLIGEPMLINL
jgi:peptide/nickel transport system ATP-binding protein